LSVAVRAALAFIAIAGACRAQDPFEIHVYQYESLEPGRFTLEQHLNYVAIGSKTPSGTVAPSNDQFHMTYELTGAITENTSFGVMLLSAARPGGSGLEYAGWRFLPHLYAPKSWGLPVDLGFVAEFSFQKTAFEENSRRAELRPIVEKSFGSVQVTANPVFERALKGPGVREGWGFEPALRVGYQGLVRFAPSLEYYSATGPARVHQFYAGGDWKLSKNLLWNLGVGVGATHAGDRLVVKSRMEFEFGRKAP
jgi:hypothetical protein